MGSLPGEAGLRVFVTTDFANLSALLETDAAASPFRPTRQVLVQGVNRTLDFDRILALPRRAEEIDPAIEAALNRWLQTDEHRAWSATRKAWHAVHKGDDENSAAAFAAVPAARTLPEIAIGKLPIPDKPQESLRSIQSRAVGDAFALQGLFAPIGVGHGKFLISILLITLIEDARARDGLPPLKWLLLVPANLLKQTQAEIAKARRHWRTPLFWTQTGAAGGGIRVESYDKLSSAKAAKAILDDYAPDAVVADECHKLKRTSSGRTRRFLRYFRDRPATRFFGMSGSVTRKTIRDYWHLVHLALPNHPPLPRSFAETEAWCQALDDAPDSDFRRAPGALLDLCDPDEIEALSPGWKTSPETAKLSYYGADERDQEALLEIVRKGYRKRLRETPGVVATTDGALGTSLVIAERVPPAAPANIVECFRHLRTTWQTPNGDEIDGGVSLWRHACELASGFWYRWDPIAPKNWLAARQDWNRFVRYVLAHNRQRLDTPLQVVQAVERGALSNAFGDGAVFLQAWRDVRDTFEPNPKPQWESTWLVEDAIRWFDEQVDDDTGKPVTDRCVAWVGLSAVGTKIEELSGGRIKHFGGGAEASTKILTHKGPIVCSIPAHGTGKNLQRYSRNLVMHWPSGADIAEQLLGRTHRPGQDADEVRVDVYMHALELRGAFDTSLRGADYIEKSTGATQKLTYANVTRRPTEDVAALTAANDPMWRK